MANAKDMGATPRAPKLNSSIYGHIDQYNENNFVMFFQG